MTGPLRLLSRRDFGRLALAAGVVAALPRLGFAALAHDTKLHGLSPFGDLKYPADYQQFDYASPDAPQGGRFTFTVPAGCSIRRPIRSTRSTPSFFRATRRRGSKCSMKG